MHSGSTPPARRSAERASASTPTRRTTRSGPPWRWTPKATSSSPGRAMGQEDNGQLGDGWGVYARRYDSYGTALASEFQVNVDRRRQPAVLQRRHGRETAASSSSGRATRRGLTTISMDRASIPTASPFARRAAGRGHTHQLPAYTVDSADVPMANQITPTWRCLWPATSGGHLDQRRHGAGSGNGFGIASPQDRERS